MSGSPMVCVHGFMDSPHTWDLVRPMLEREHEVLTPALPGHLGGPPIAPGAISGTLMADAVERAMDEAGLETAHLVGNSLGGHVALQLAARGRARTVVALAPAGGWAPGDASRDELLAMQVELHEQARAIGPQAELVLATPEARRRATRLLTVRWEHLPVDVLAWQLRALAACEAAPALAAYAGGRGSGSWELDAERIACPVRIVWGTADRLLPWPAAAERYRREWLPQADWVELDDVGHAPQLDVPLECAQLILGFTR